MGITAATYKVHQGPLTANGAEIGKAADVPVTAEQDWPQAGEETTSAFRQDGPPAFGLWEGS